MRVMAGLTSATSGTALVGDMQGRDIPNPGTQVGVLLDASAQHAGRTGREVLTLTAMTMGLPSSRVDEMLDLVSLSQSEAKRRVRNYSLGMRQRLGIAAALLGDPKILILDEPANGLDPAGIHWMRSLLREYANRGGTVLLSSHLLHEIEVIADEIIVIGEGKIVAQGTKAELLQSAGTFVKAGDASALANALTAAGNSTTPSREGFSTAALPEEVGKAAAAAGVALVELRPADGAGLEEMFLQLTAGTQRDAVATEGAPA
jgi:ABC-2 type transport system ATP-binding protein